MGLKMSSFRPKWRNLLNLIEITWYIDLMKNILLLLFSLKLFIYQSRAQVRESHKARIAYKIVL